MTLRARLLLLTSLLVAACVLLTSGVLGYEAWRSLRERAMDEAALASTLLGRVAAVAEQAPDQLESVAGDALATEAYLVSEMVDLAGRANLPAAELGQRLRELAARTDLDEVWVTDRQGTPVASSYDEVDATIAEDGPVIGELVDKIRGSTRFVTVSGVIHRDIDRAAMKYAGVRRMDSAGVVLTGRNALRLSEETERLGVRNTLELILAARDVEGVWITDESLGVVAGAAPPGATPDLALAGRSMREAVAVTAQEGGRLVAAAPILDRDGLPSGSAIVSMPTAQLQAALAAFAADALVVTLVVLALGFLLASLVARHIGTPIATIARAAGDVEARRFRPESIERVAARPDELGDLAGVFLGMAVQVMNREAELERLVRERTAELVAKNEALEAAQRQMEEELTAAQALQAAILPHRFEPEATHAVSAYMMPAQHMGCDFYDVFRIDEHRYGFAIADVAGKGVLAAFFMAISRTVLRNYGREGLPPGECLLRANQELCRMNPMELFVTVFYGVLDTRTGELAYANGGHPDVYLVRSKDGLERLPRTGGMALGVLEQVPYREAAVRLSPGDMLFLLTDGIPEAMNRDGDLFGEAVLVEELVEARRQPLPEVVRRVVASVHRLVGDPAPAA